MSFAQSLIQQAHSFHLKLLELSYQHNVSSAGWLYDYFIRRICTVFGTCLISGVKVCIGLHLHQTLHLFVLLSSTLPVCFSNPLTFFSALTPSTCQFNMALISNFNLSLHLFFPFSPLSDGLTFLSV